jgi:hypothetical protein
MIVFAHPFSFVVALAVAVVFLSWFDRRRSPRGGAAPATGSPSPVAPQPTGSGPAAAEAELEPVVVPRR